jgi:uncharacterized membrane protein
MRHAFIILLLILTVLPIGAARAEGDSTESELMTHTTTLMRARVLSIEGTETRTIAGTSIQNEFQTIRVEILEGEQKNTVVTVENDYLNMDVGDEFYLARVYDPLRDIEYYNVNDPYRLPQLMLLAGLFVLSVLLFGGIQGIRGLLSLIGSIFFIFYLLLPGILAGYSPLLITIVVASIIIILGSYITHGFTKTTSAAVIGMIVTVIITGLLAYWSVDITRLSGFGSEEAIYLNQNADGRIDILGLLMSGIIIGLLGVLYDAAIGQSVSVEELARMAPHASRWKIFERVVRIGREHIGALINTLAIAYVGSALPLLLLFFQSQSATPIQILNTELFATEIVRILIGSIGLVLAVPITTLVSVFMLVRPQSNANSTLLAAEEKLLNERTHTHCSHGHSH